MIQLGFTARRQQNFLTAPKYWKQLVNNKNMTCNEICSQDYELHIEDQIR